MDRMKNLLRKPLTWILVAVLVVGVGVGAFLFQPWKLFTDKTVDETLPDTVEDSDAEVDGESSQPEGPVAVVSGEFITQEHDTAGAVEIVENPDGSLQLAIEELATSNGPDLRVWLTDQAVDPDEWSVFDDGYYVELGKLKGNEGNQVYDIPDDVDLEKVTSVSIWCKRFSVSFGAAELA